FSGDVYAALRALRIAVRAAASERPVRRVMADLQEQLEGAWLAFASDVILRSQIDWEALRDLVRSVEIHAGDCRRTSLELYQRCRRDSGLRRSRERHAPAP